MAGWLPSPSPGAGEGQDRSKHLSTPARPASLILGCGGQGAGCAQLFPDLSRGRTLSLRPATMAQRAGLGRLGST